MSDIISSNSVVVAKNSIFLAMRMVIVTFIAIFTTRYLLNNLGVEDFGVYNVTLGIVSMCTFLSPALSNAVQRYFSYELGKNGVSGAKKVFNASVQIQVIMILTIILICETVGLWYVLENLVVPKGRELAAFWVYQISVIAISISMLQIPFVAAVLAHERMGFYAIVNIIDAIFKLAIAIGIAYAEYDKLIFYGVLLLGINIFNLCLYVFYSRTYFKEIRFQYIIDKPLLKGMLSFSGWNIFETIARIGKDEGGNLLLNYFFGPVLNAARGITNQVSYGFSSIVDSTVMASRPQMVASYAKGNIQHSLSMFYSLSKGTLLLLYMLSIPIFFDIDYILKIWIGTNIPAYSIELIRLSIIMLLIDKLASPVTALIHATGKVKYYHLLSGIINISVVPIAWLFFCLGYDPTSIYIITIIGVIIAQVVFLYVIKNVISFSIWTYIKKVFLPFLIVFFLSSWIPYIIETYMSEGYLRLLVIISTSVVSTTIVSFMVALTKAERNIIIKLINR